MILVLIADVLSHSVNMHIYNWTLTVMPLFPYFVYASNEGTGSIVPSLPDCTSCILSQGMYIVVTNRLAPVLRGDTCINSFACWVIFHNFVAVCWLFSAN